MQACLPLPGATLQHIYVASLGTDPQASQVRRDLISELKKNKGFDVVSSPAGADAVLSGDAELYLREYYSLYVRAGTSPENGKPIFGGYVSVELKSSSGETLWSYLASAGAGSKDAPSHLSKDIVKHLVNAMAGTKTKTLTGKK